MNTFANLLEIAADLITAGKNKGKQKQKHKDRVKPKLKPVFWYGGIDKKMSDEIRRKSGYLLYRLQAGELPEQLYAESKNQCHRLKGHHSDVWEFRLDNEARSADGVLHRYGGTWRVYFLFEHEAIYILDSELKKQDHPSPGSLAKIAAGKKAHQEAKREAKRMREQHQKMQKNP